MIKRALPVLLAALVFITISPFIFTDIDIHHDYLLLKPALDLNTGKMLFKDSFTQYGALTTILQAAAIRINPHQPLVAIRTLTALSYALLSLLLWLVWSRFLKPIANTTAVILWLGLAAFYNWGLAPWSSVFALIFQCLTVLFIRTNPLLAGAATAAAFWTRQPVGVFLYAAILLYLILIKQTRRILSYSAGLILFSLPIFLWIYANGALTDWWLQSFGLAAALTNCHGLSCASTLALDLSGYKFWHQNVRHLIWLILPLTTVYSTIKTKPWFLLSLISLASWLQYYPVPDPYHYFWAATPMIGILVYFISRKIVKAPLLILCILFYFSRVQVGFNHIANQIASATNPPTLAGMKAPPGHVEYYDFITRYLDAYFRANPTKRYINRTPDAFYATLHPNFHMSDPVYVNWELINNSIYPQHLPQLRLYVAQEHPLIFSNDPPVISGYCWYTFPSRPVKLYIPKDTIHTINVPTTFSLSCP